MLISVAYYVLCNSLKEVAVCVCTSVIFFNLIVNAININFAFFTVFRLCTIVCCKFDVMYCRLLTNSCCFH